MWCALQHEPCVGATEMLFNLYNKKYIAFFCSITRRGVSVFLAMWRGIATRMEAGFVFSELARLQFPFTFSLTCKCSIRSNAVCNSLYSSYLNLHLSLWVHINVLSAQHYILLSWRQIMSFVAFSLFFIFIDNFTACLNVWMQTLLWFKKTCFFNNFLILKCMCHIIFKAKMVPASLILYFLFCLFFATEYLKVMSKCPLMG